MQGRCRAVVASIPGVGPTGMCILGRLSGSILARAVAVRGAAAAGGGGCVEEGLEGTLRRARGFRSAAVAMAPIKVTAGPVRPGLTASPPPSISPRPPVPLKAVAQPPTLPAALFPCPGDRSPPPRRLLRRLSPTSPQRTPPSSPVSRVSRTISRDCPRGSRAFSPAFTGHPAMGAQPLSGDGVPRPPPPPGTSSAPGIPFHPIHYPRCTRLHALS